MASKAKKQFAWALYDWGNSAFSTSIMAGFFPVFYKSYWSEGADATLTTARLGTLIAVASISVAIMSPILGAFADYTGSKKKFLFFFALLGISSALLMGLAGPGEWFLASVFYTVGISGFFGSMSFYDGLLPGLAKGDEADRISLWGYALGYLGGGILLTIHVLWLWFSEWFGFESEVSVVKWAFFSVGLWWLLFTLPLLIWVDEPKKNSRQNTVPKEHEPAFYRSQIKDFKIFGLHSEFWALCKLSFQKIFSTLKNLPSNRNLFRFLLAYWFYIDGIYTVMNMAVDYGLSFGLESQSLITALLLVQFIGFPSTLAFIKLSHRWGYKIPILGSLVAYCLVLIGAINMSQTWHFFVLATIIGLVQGGVQALSRSLYSNLIPEEEASCYFGLFNFVAKFAAIMGPILVGWGTFLTGSHRFGMGSLLILFFLGTFFMLKVQPPRFRP